MGTESSPKNFQQSAVDDQKDSVGSLILQIAGGNDAALESLYDQTIGKTYALAYAITKSHQEAEEVTCDVYTQVWVKACSFSIDRGKGMAWLMTICRSRSLDMLRRKQAQFSSDNATATNLSETIPDLQTPELALSRFQQKSEITRALGRLSSVQRDAVLLAFFHGSSHGDVATILGLPLGTVKSHLRRALQSMQNILELNP